MSIYYLKYNSNLKYQQNNPFIKILRNWMQIIKKNKLLLLSAPYMSAWALQKFCHSAVVLGDSNENRQATRTELSSRRNALLDTLRLCTVEQENNG